MSLPTMKGFWENHSMALRTTHEGNAALLVYINRISKTNSQVLDSCYARASLSFSHLLKDISHRYLGDIKYLTRSPATKF